MPGPLTFDQETQDRILSHAIFTPIHPLDPTPPEDREPRLRAIIASVKRHNKHVRDNIIREAKLEIAKARVSGRTKNAASRHGGSAMDVDGHDSRGQDPTCDDRNGAPGAPAAISQASLNKLLRSLNAPCDPSKPEKYLWKPSGSEDANDETGAVVPKSDSRTIALLQRFDATAN